MKSVRLFWNRLRAHLPRGKTVALMVGVGVTIASFQNCGKVHMVTGLESLGDPVMSLSDVTIKVVLNTKKTVNLSAGMPGAKISLDQTSVLLSQVLPDARVDVNQDDGTLVFTPNMGFRGDVPVVVYVRSGNVINVQHITFEVENPVLDFQPALAVRGAECVLCHANVQGDMISDFGFKAATDNGPDLFLQSAGDTSGDHWISAYAVAHEDEDSLKTATIAGKLAIPKIQIADYLASSSTRTWFPKALGQIASGVVSFADYIMNYEKPTNADFEGVSELSQLYIGSQTKADILAASGVPANGKKFFKNTATDPDLDKFELKTVGPFSFWTNTGEVPCDGDLFVDGVVFLNNLHLKTAYGCRLYATHSVFINGPITYVDEGALSNLQIVSPTGIFMGLGSCIDCTNFDSHGYAGKNTLAGRWQEIQDLGALPALRSKTYAQIVQDSMADYALVSNSLNGVPTGLTTATDYVNYFTTNGIQLVDATNSLVNQGNTGFHRVLLNAPVVMSRYSGDFEGVVISEFALWPLGAFKFTFDPVFTGVPLIPFLDFSKSLSIKQ